MATEYQVEVKRESGTKGRPKRAICLAGGGPAAGLHIGVLKGLRDAGITFDTKHDVWALSSIGAWVGTIYNQAENDRIQETTNFFRGVFREDKSFDSFPLNTVFTPDWAGNAEAMWEFLIDPKTYKTIVLPKEIIKSFMYTVSVLRRCLVPGGAGDADITMKILVKLQNLEKHLVKEILIDGRLTTCWPCIQSCAF
jgi:predicted acylesterase/phospholipase RssA